MKRIVTLCMFVIILLFITGINLKAQHHHHHGSSVVIIDPNLPDVEILLKGIKRGARIVYLDNSKNPLKAILKIVKENAPVSSLHIFSEGKPGLLVFSADDVSQESLERDEAILGSWKEYFNVHGDILLYGCDVAKGDDGISFIRTLAVLTGLDIAASDNLTGSYIKGGDWYFEVRSGRIESSLIVSKKITQEYSAVLRKNPVKRNKELLANAEY